MLLLSAFLQKPEIAISKEVISVRRNLMPANKFLDFSYSLLFNKDNAIFVPYRMDALLLVGVVATVACVVPMN